MPAEPINIELHIGRKPVVAGGNSDGDLQMLQWTAAGDGRRLMLIVHHTDGEREYAYDRDSHVGRLKKGLSAGVGPPIDFDPKIHRRFIGNAPVVEIHF